MTDSLRLIIAGGSKKGTLYGVCTFLEKYLGCRIYSPSVNVVPEQEKILLGKVNDKQIPAIRYRTFITEVHGTRNMPTGINSVMMQTGKGQHGAYGSIPLTISFLRKYILMITRSIMRFETAAGYLLSCALQIPMYLRSRCRI
jgi:hypothetical protein